MAYGLNVTDLIFTDSERLDLGTLEDYEIDLDIAKEKDFEMTINDFVITNDSQVTSAQLSTVNGATVGELSNLTFAAAILDNGQSIQDLISNSWFWYVEGTEYGGIVDGYETDTEENKIIFKGRSWRGIENSKIVYGDSENIDLTVSGYLADIANMLYENFGLSDLFVMEDPDINLEYYESQAENQDDPITWRPDYISSWTITTGLTVHKALSYMADYVDVTYIYSYNPADRKVHITPIDRQDYSEQMLYNDENTNGFKASNNNALTNHLVCVGVYEDDSSGKDTYEIHIFTDSNRAIQPYLNTYPTYEGAVTQAYEYTSSDASSSDWLYEDATTPIVQESTEETDIIYVIIGSTDGTETSASSDYLDYQVYWDGSQYQIAGDSAVKVTDPTEDDDYILTTDNRVLDGISEIVEYRESNPSITTSYKLVTSEEKPDDWDTKFGAYYTYEAAYEDEDTGEWYDESYNSVTGTEKEIYTALTEEPDDWSASYDQYYEISEDEWDYDYETDTGTIEKKYSSVSGVTEQVGWEKVTADWVCEQYDDDENLTLFSKAWVQSYSLYYYKLDEETFGSDVYRSYSAKSSSTEVFVPLTSVPDDWEDNWVNYYTRKEDSISSYKKWEAANKNGGDYTLVPTGNSLYIYKSLSDDKMIKATKPNPWPPKDDSWGNYYYHKKTGANWTYEQVTWPESTSYTKITGQKPDEWDDNYSSFFTLKKRWRYKSSSKCTKGLSKHKKEKAYKQCSFWKHKEGSYYVLYAFVKAAARKVKVKGKKKEKPAIYKSGKYWEQSKVYVEGSQKTWDSKWKKDRMYIKDPNVETPKWTTNKYYTKESVTIPPAVDIDNCYLPKTNTVAPEWTATDDDWGLAKYYSKSTENTAPTYEKDKYWSLVEDHYKAIVDDAIEYLNGLESKQTQELTLGDLYTYNIGDIIAGKDDITGLFVKDKVTNKIVKIDNGVVYVEYEIGGDDDEQ